MLGHEQPLRHFLALRQAQHLPHAYLLYGMKGIGKTLFAHHCATAFLCENVQKDQPACARCASCVLQQAQQHPDVLSLSKAEGKRDLSIAQIREGLHFLSLSGMRSRKRVLIIDDADRMNLSAANALLKCLEEPKEQSLIVLIAHDLMALPVTIRSRCQRQALHPLSEEDCHTVLSRFLPAENRHLLLLAQQIAQGCPGSVFALQEQEVAEACLQWAALIDPLARFDVAAVQQWIEKFIKKVPLSMLSRMLVDATMEIYMRPAMHLAAEQQLAKAIHDLLCYEQHVQRYALRPGPTLLARMLALRLGLRAYDA